MCWSITQVFNEASRCRLHIYAYSRICASSDTNNATIIGQEDVPTQNIYAVARERTFTTTSARSIRSAYMYIYIWM